jgi:hypothetical protein
MVGEISDVLANLIIAARFNNEPIVRARAEVYLADGDASTPHLQDRDKRPVLLGSFEPRHPADGCRFANADASDKRDLVLAFA